MDFSSVFPLNCLKPKQQAYRTLCVCVCVFLYLGFWYAPVLVIFWFCAQNPLLWCTLQKLVLNSSFEGFLFLFYFFTSDFSLFQSMICPCLSVSSRGWCRFRGPGEWYELLLGELVLHLQWSADRVHPTTPQWTALFLTATPPSSSSHATQPASARSALTRAKPHLPGAHFLLVHGLTPNWPPTVSTHAHPGCQVVVPTWYADSYTILMYIP